MVKVIGNLQPQDDYTHPLGPEPNFNESVYFNFFDRQHNRGGFIRMGNRANEGYAEMTVLLFNSDGSAYFNYKKPEIQNNDGWDAGGAQVVIVTPGEEIRTTYTGAALFMQNPRDMRDPGRAFKSNPFRKITLDLTHYGVGPMYGHVGAEGDGNDFARAHYEQHMRVSGQLTVEGESAPVEIHGHGLRDHSWGPRYWQSTPSYRWITGNFNDQLGMILMVSKRGRGGLFHKGDELVRIKDLELETEYEPDSHFHRSLRADIRLENGDRHELVGRVKGFIPLRNRRSEQVTYIGEGMTEYTLDGALVGYGLSEYLDQPGEEL